MCCRIAWDSEESTEVVVAVILTWNVRVARLTTNESNRRVTSARREGRDPSFKIDDVLVSPIAIPNPAASEKFRPAWLHFTLKGLVGKIKPIHPMVVSYFAF